MIKFLMVITLGFSLKSMAFSNSYGEKQCDRNDAVRVDITVTKDRFEPRIIYLQEKDKVCLYVSAVDYPVSFSIDRHPVVVTVRPGKQSFTYFVVNKVGEYNIQCKGGCALGVKPKIIVQSKEEFEKFQEEKYREKSEKYRKKVGERQIQPKYNNENESHRRPKSSNPYDTQKYRSKFLDEEDEE